jgi:predicted metal-binding membrane protein
MSPESRGRWRIRIPLMSASILGWVAILVMLLMKNPPNHESAHQSFAFEGWIISWPIMVVAMMLPTLTLPIQHVQNRSLKRHQLGAIASFLAGYGLIWLIVGIFMFWTVFALDSITYQWRILPITAGIILLWQISPLKQKMLNLSHQHPTFATIGPAAMRGPFEFGMTHGRLCSASCIGLMLTPFVAPINHEVAMIIISGWIWFERSRPWAIPAWGIRFTRWRPAAS